MVYRKCYSPLLAVNEKQMWRRVFFSRLSFVLSTKFLNLQETAIWDWLWPTARASTEYVCTSVGVCVRWLWGEKKRHCATLSPPLLYTEQKSPHQTTHAHKHAPPLSLTLWIKLDQKYRDGDSMTPFCCRGRSCTSWLRRMRTHTRTYWARSLNLTQHWHQHHSQTLKLPSAPPL